MIRTLYDALRVVDEMMDSEGKDIADKVTITLRSIFYFNFYFIREIPIQGIVLIM
jgi:hypothetical protein